MNVTLSIDDEIVVRARELAAQRGTSLNQLIRDYLEDLASGVSAEDAVAELEKLWTTDVGDSRGLRWTREDLHERSGVR